MFFDTKECEWSDQSVYFNGVKIGKITGFKFKKSKEKEHLYADGDEPIDIQGGNKKYEGTLTVLRGALTDMNTAVKAQNVSGVDDILDARVVIGCNYRAKGNRLLQTHVCSDVEFTDFEQGYMQGDKKQEVAIPFLFLRLKST